MKISYDYSEFIEEIQEELETAVLSTNENIWIVRADDPIHESYRPIIDWYYLEDLKDKASEEADKFKVVKVNVGEILEEMERINDVLRGI